MAGHRDGGPRVRSVGVLQMGYMGAAMGLLLAIIVGALTGIFSAGLGAYGRGMGSGFGFIGIAIACLLYPVFGFIGGCIYGLLYNLAGLIAGGLEIEVK